MNKTHTYQISFDGPEDKEALKGTFIRMKILFPGITVSDMDGNEVEVGE